jgi:hypothetical protein
VICTPTRLPDAELRRLAAEDLFPDVSSAEAAIGPTYVDERRILRRLPSLAAQAA